MNLLLTKKQSLTMAAAVAIAMLSACNHNYVEVEVTNGYDVALGTRMIELDAEFALSKIESPSFYIADAEGNEIPSQITSGGLLIFPAEVAPGQTAVYKIMPADEGNFYENKVFGAIYPERRDDIAYENDLVGFRIYGPGTQNAGERAYGYDLFFKYPGEIVLPELYRLETDPATWQRVDSLRRIDPKLADEYVDSFSYHIDHGKGMDCYAVGATLGAGVAAILNDSTIAYPWCYSMPYILDNGPLRFTLQLVFDPVTIGTDTAVVENRIITLDAGSHLNHTSIWYDGLENPADIVAGFPLRDDSPWLSDNENGIIAYADPTQGPNNGKALLGIVAPQADSIFIHDGHLLTLTKGLPGGEMSYLWGFAWDKTDFKDLTSWAEYLENANKNYMVHIKK